MDEVVMLHNKYSAVKLHLFRHTFIYQRMQSCYPPYQLICNNTHECAMSLTVIQIYITGSLNQELDHLLPFELFL